MNRFRFSKGSLLWRILLATSAAITVVFALTGWMVQRYAANVSQRSLEEEIRTSLQAYESIWSARVHNLTSVSRIVSSMSDVRSAFMTRDRATIRDTAEQLWSQVSEEDASFVVLDPTGQVIASLGGRFEYPITSPLMHTALAHFPNQASGYVRRGTHLYYLVFTPVYVQAETGGALLNVLLVAFDINDTLARELKQWTHGSDFAFVSFHDVIASTLPLASAEALRSGTNTHEGARRLNLHGSDYLLMGRDLHDVSGGLTGQLFIIRSFAGPERVLIELQRNVAAFWVVAILVSLALSYFLYRRILRPVERLDHAAEQVANGRYDYRVPVESHDELGRLAFTFNAMCESILNARQDLIRQERIATIGRLSGSIVHDLRNPLAAIYGGAEMLVDAELSSEQQRRLAESIYRASRRIQELLQELLDVSQMKARRLEAVNLLDVCRSAGEQIAEMAALHSLSIEILVPERLEVIASRDRLERVFLNLMNNAADAMPEGGRLWITASEDKDLARVSIEDNGPGIPDEAWPTLFQPFASFRKRNGLGLGLALSRQTLLDFGGDLRAERKSSPGALFVLCLPLAQGVPAESKAGHSQTEATAGPSGAR